MAVNVGLKAADCWVCRERLSKMFWSAGLSAECFLPMLCFHILFCRLICLLWSGNDCIWLGLWPSRTAPQIAITWESSQCAEFLPYMGAGGGELGVFLLFPFEIKSCYVTQEILKLAVYPQISLILGTLSQPFKIWDISMGCNTCHNSVFPTRSPADTWGAWVYMTGLSPKHLESCG